MPKKGTKLQIIGIILLIASVFGVLEITVLLITRTLLGNPAPNTTGRAIVNIATLLSSVIGILGGVAILIVGTIRQGKYTRAVSKK